jgi:rfaE bifunctional protein kinase chain/domain
MLKNSAKSASELIDKCHGKRIAVVGDIMLDRYYWGSVSRVSPEAPVPVIDLESETWHLGGAANVASNLATLGACPILCGLIGNDSAGDLFRRAAESVGISHKGLYNDPERPTTVKTRIIGNNQQIARLDSEVRDSISGEGEDYIYSVLSNDKELSAIIFEDYNKGTLTPTLIKRIISLAAERSLPVFVDPKFENFFNFQSATVFKPNKKEAAQAIGFPLVTKEDISRAGKLLLEKTNAENILLTLGADGMMLFEKSGAVYSVPTHARRVSDVSGAGDTAIATLSAIVAAGGSVAEAADIANFAAGVVCEQPGIVSITKEALIESIERDED